MCSIVIFYIFNSTNFFRVLEKVRKSDDFRGGQPLQSAVYTNKNDGFSFFHWVTFWPPNVSKMRSPGSPKLEKVMSGISSFLGVVFGSTFDEK